MGASQIPFLPFVHGWMRASLRLSRLGCNPTHVAKISCVLLEYRIGINLPGGIQESL
jgi:hypothetical protein